MKKDKVKVKGVAVLIENKEPVAAGKEVTNRGFRIDRFKDEYGAECSLQKSSSAMKDCVWLGIQNADPIVMASDALKLGRPDLCRNGETVGWVKWPVPDEVHISTRMHLTRKQVADLLPALQHFVETGDLP